MSKTYIAEAMLKTSKADEQYLDHCFFLGSRAANCMVKEANRRLNAYRRDRAVKDIFKRQRAKGYKLTAKEKDILKDKREQYGLSEYAFQKYLKVYGYSVSEYLDSNTVQKIATRVWQGMETILFGKGKHLHFKKYDQFLSMEGKTNKQGIRCKDGCLVWKKLRVPIRIRGKDTWFQMALLDRVKYCRIVRKWHNTHFRYYLQLVLEGTPPTKSGRTALNAIVGLDLGVSTVAAVSRYGAIFQELGDGGR